MPCGATGVLLRIGTSCCADTVPIDWLRTNTAKVASAAGKNQRTLFMRRLLDTGLCTVRSTRTATRPLGRQGRPHFATLVDEYDGVVTNDQPYRVEHRERCGARFPHQ